MTATRRCPRCRAELSPDRPDGLCPACLMGAVASPEPGPEDESLTGADLARADTVEAEPLPRSDPLPRIPRYRLLEPVGEGGMGVVYKAEQLAPVHRTVAIKLIKLGMDTRQVVARFESERQALALLSHPNVAAVYDGGATDTGRPYFVMEWVPGEPITEFCDRHNYTTKQRLELFIQACVAMQHAHQKAIIHRDIKPTNILVMLEDGRPLVKVIDFGVAKATAQRLTEATLFTAQGQLIGTPEYMSPEQAEMSAVDIDTRSDVYSLGVVLYELLSGSLPFDARSLRQAAFAEIQRIIREVDPPRPSTRLSSLGAAEGSEIARRRQMQLSALERELRSELEWIPLKAIRKDRGERYGSAAALAEDLRNYLEHRPLVAGPESAAYRVRKFVRRNKGPVAAGVSLVLVLAAGVAVASWQAIRIRAEQQQTLLQKNEAERQREQAQRQELEAKNQAAIADATNDFLTAMLAAADPGRLLGDKVTVLQAIEGALRELDAGKLKGQPQVEVAVRITIGDTMHSLGRYAEALSILERALAIGREVLPPMHASIANCLRSIGWVLLDQGKLAEAEPRSREALEIHRKILPSGHPSLVGSLYSLGFVVAYRGKAAEAEQLFREALDIERKTLPPDHPDIAGGLDSLGLLLKGTDRFAEAQSMLREGLRIRRKALPPGDLAIAYSLNNLGYLLKDQGEWAEAEPLFREALEIRRKALPATHPMVGGSLSSLGWVLFDQGKFGEAEPLFREALEIHKALPTGHKDIAGALESLGRTLRAQGKLAEAEPLCREALEIRRKALPAGHRDVLGSLDSLGWVLKGQGKLIEAEAMFREALETRRKTQPPGHPSVALSLNNLGWLLKDQGKLVEAEALFREALVVRRKALPAGHPVLVFSLNSLAALLRDQKQFADAETLLIEARDSLLASGRKAHPQMLKALTVLAEVYDATNRPELAANARREIAELKAATQPSTQPATAPTTRPV